VRFGTVRGGREQISRPPGRFRSHLVEPLHFEYRFEYRLLTSHGDLDHGALLEEDRRISARLPCSDERVADDGTIQRLIAERDIQMILRERQLKGHSSLES
jgi:hypothetical protein